jgi:hypothetical protein
VFERLGEALFRGKSYGDVSFDNGRSLANPAWSADAKAS